MFYAHINDYIFGVTEFLKDWRVFCVLQGLSFKSYLVLASNNFWESVHDTPIDYYDIKCNLKQGMSQLEERRKKQSLLIVACIFPFIKEVKNLCSYPHRWYTVGDKMGIIGVVSYTLRLIYWKLIDSVK